MLIPKTKDETVFVRGGRPRPKNDRELQIKLRELGVRPGPLTSVVLL